MITATVFLIMSIFGSGPNFFSIPETEARVFTIHKLENQLGNHIADKQREKEALLIFKQAKKEIKALEKELKAYGKAFKKLQKDRNAAREELEEVFEKSEEARKAVQSILVEKRLELRKLLTEKEWSGLLEQGMADLEVNPQKREKEIKKFEKSDSKIIDKIKKSLNKQFTDESRRSEALEAYANFENKASSFTDESMAYMAKNEETAQLYDAEKTDLEKVFIALNQSREEAMLEFLQMRGTLIELSSEKEWKKVAKTLNRLF